MNEFRITLRAGEMMIGEDEIEPLIEQLEALRRKRDEPSGKKPLARIDYEQVRAILQRKYPQSSRLKVRLGRLWSAVARAELQGEVPFDAICTACNTALRNHAKQSPKCYKVATSSAVVTVDPRSLHGYGPRFLAYAARNAGPAVCADYRYLLSRIPKE